MGKKYRAICAVLLILLGAEIWLLAHPPKPQLYSGKELREWYEERKSSDPESRLRAIKVIAGAMRSEDGVVCTNAAKALVQCGPEAAPEVAKAVVPALIEALNNKDARARSEVIFVLYMIRSESETKDAVPALLRVAREDDNVHNRHNALALAEELSPKSK
jgi:hypothetical protein